MTALNDPPRSGARKAALLLLTLGEEASAEILRHFNEEEVQAVSRELARISSAPPEQIQAVLEEFSRQVLDSEPALAGGPDYAQRILASAFGPERATGILAEAFEGGARSFDALEQADPQQLAKFLHREHPQTIALILSHLNSLQAGMLLGSLPAAMRADVALRMAKLDRISPDIAARIASLIEQKLKAVGEFSREPRGGVRAVARMLHRLDPAVSNEVLAGIERQDAAIGETIRDLMFMFEDLLLVDESGIRELLGRLDRRLLTVALKGAPEELSTRFTLCMSARGAETLREDMEALGSVKPSEVEAARHQIVALARQLEAEGVLKLRQPPEDPHAL